MSDETQTYYACCLACHETWTIDTHPDWLPPFAAAEELRTAIRDHQIDCPVRHAGNEMGLVS